MSALLIPGDVTRILPDLIRQGVKVHMVATSTPYYRQRKYPIPDTDFPEFSYKPIYGLQDVTVKAWTGQLGREESPFDFIGHLVWIFRWVHEVLRDDGTIWVNLGDKYVGEGGVSGTDPKNKNRKRENDNCPEGPGIPPRKNLLAIPERFRLAMQADGWVYRNEVVWKKPNANPMPVLDRLTVDHEDVMMFSKGPRYYFDVEPIRTPLKPSTIARDGYRRMMEHKAEHEEAQGGAMRHDHETISNPAGAQRRTVWDIESVWEIATGHSLEGHYAVFPPDLVEPMIRASTSEYGCCGECGANYIRMIQRPKPPEELTGTERREIPGQPAVIDRKRNNRALCDWRQANPPRTTGWQKPCKCETGRIIRPVVLDIFSGEGSTGDAALRLGRDYVGIDADEKSTRAAVRRLKPLDNAPLFESRPSIVSADTIATLDP
jgi:DNA modification methylase